MPVNHISNEQLRTTAPPGVLQWWSYGTRTSYPLTHQLQCTSVLTSDLLTLNKSPFTHAAANIYHKINFLRLSIHYRARSRFGIVWHQISIGLQVSYMKRRKQIARSDVTVLDKKLSYHRGTARCVVSVEVLPIAMQQCRNYLYDKSWTNLSYEVGRLQWADV